MTKSLSIQLQKPHYNQDKVLKEAKRFSVLKCGRRFGKSTLSIYKAAEALVQGHYVAYFAPTYKDASEWWSEIGWRLQP
ncbi:hypothetical protein, partial [Escherichia coli]|uniref:hypothetical protein n=1 Tax=Escherichia coli TaxID=562 RepID=UPI00200CCA9D